METRLLQIHLNVIDLDRAVRFYQNALGLKSLERPTAVWASFVIGETELGLFKTENRSPYIQRGPDGSRAGATLTFHSTNIKVDRARIEAEGATIIDEQIKPWGHVLIFEDTEGNTLRLMTESQERIERRRKR